MKAVGGKVYQATTRRKRQLLRHVDLEFSLSCLMCFSYGF